MSWGPRRRFWTQAGVRPRDAGYGVDLDDRPLQTPARQLLLLPTRPLAEAIAAEWNAIEAEIRPEALPLTRAANSATDRVAPDPGPVIDAIAAYGGSDLLCYRAEEPLGLVRRQSAAWTPWLDWSGRALGAPLLAVVGVMHHPQPAESLARLRAHVAAFDAFELTALHDLVSLSGSLVLGLAVSRGALAPEAAWDLSRIDEAWQAEQWGEDAGAAHQAGRRRADFLRAEHLLQLLTRQADI